LPQGKRDLHFSGKAMTDSTEEILSDNDIRTQARGRDEERAK